MLHKLCNNQYISYYFYYRAHKPQGKMYVWEIPCSLKISSVLHFRQQNTEIHFLFLSSRPTYRLQRAHGIGTELFAERSQLPDMLHTQRLIYFGGRKRGLSYAARGSKEIHFTHTHTHTHKSEYTSYQKLAFLFPFQRITSQDQDRVIYQMFCQLHKPRKRNQIKH